MDQDIPYNGYPNGLSYGGYPSVNINGNEHMVYDGFFPNITPPKPSLLGAISDCIDASTDHMPIIKHGRVCSRGSDGMWHIHKLAQ